MYFRSVQGGPDWTCVIVGFSSGYVRFYTEVSVQDKVVTVLQLVHRKIILFHFIMQQALRRMILLHYNLEIVLIALY